MRITFISITNMAAFASFEAKLPSVVMIQGRNGEGKTSFLDCIRFAFDRGHNEDMIHGDAPEGEILIEMENGAAIKCRSIREKHETIRSWRAPGSKRFVVGRDQIDSIAKAISYDPLAFLEMTEQRQLETLLRIMPIECSSEEIAAAAGAQAIIPATGTALERIAALRKQLYDQRRDYNVAADAQEKHAAELEKALPPAAPEGTEWDAEVKRLRQLKDQLEAKQADSISQIKILFEEEVAAAQQEYLTAAALASQARDQRIEGARSEANQSANEVRGSSTAALEALNTNLATASERARTQAQAEGTRQALEAAKQSAARQREESKKLTTSLERLDALKEAVAARLPIQGITITDGRIMREENGKPVPFARWNTVSKMRFCLRIAVLAHGDCGFVVLDGAERFDSEKRVALLQTAEKYAATDGMQFLIASVDDKPLTLAAPGE